MKLNNPILLFAVFSLAVFLIRNYFFPQLSGDNLVLSIEDYLSGFGVFSYLIILSVYLFCSFFFIPILIPLNIACGALYGPYVGSLVALTGIVCGSLASTISVRHVFTGMGRIVESHPAVKHSLAQIDRHGTVMIILVRLAFVVPYLIQNIVLALTGVSLVRILGLTSIGAIPGILVYCFLGAGLVQAKGANQLTIYLVGALLVFIVVSVGVKYLHQRHQITHPEASGE